MNEIAKRSEILFCYDVRMANPNGDPDENRPRIDPITKKNLVTDFRLKRTIRDYIQQKYQQQNGKKIFIRAEESDESGNLKQIEDLAEPYIEKKEDNKYIVNKEKLIKDHIDIRLFGILFAVNIRKQNISFKRIGPVQFAIGQSLHPVEEQTLRITRVVPTRKEAQGGTFGEKSVVKYSFITFRGFVNDIVAKDVELTEEDVNLMLEAMWFGTNNLSTTSKYGQKSRILLRVTYNKPNVFIGDLDRFMKMETSDGSELSQIEDVSQFYLNIDKLFDKLTAYASFIDSIYYIADNEPLCIWNKKEDTFSSHMKQWYDNFGKQHQIKVSELFNTATM